MLDVNHCLRLTPSESTSAPKWAVRVDEGVSRIFSGKDAWEQAVEHTFACAEQLRRAGSVLIVLEPVDGAPRVACIAAPDSPTASGDPRRRSIYRGPLVFATGPTAACLRQESSTSALPPSGLSHRVLALAVAALGAFCVLGAAYVRVFDSERSAVERLPDDERGALYEALARETSTVCAAAERDDALQSRCTAAATFLSTLPECDASCQARVRHHRPRATR
jgi:hypothetical protein